MSYYNGLSSVLRYLLWCTISKLYLRRNYLKTPLALLRYNECDPLYDKPIRQHGAFFNHYYPVFYYVERMISVFEMMTAVDAYIITYAAIFVDNCILNITPGTDAHIWYSMAMRMIDFL